VSCSRESPGFSRGEEVNPREIEEWVVVGTRYASTHVRQALKLLEDQGRLRKYTTAWEPGKGWTKIQPYQRKGKFPDGKIIIEFAED
jgi:hypothetical protein